MYPDPRHIERVGKMMQVGTWPEALLLPDERTYVLVAWKLGWSAH